MSLHDFPIVDSGAARLAGVAHHQSLFEFVSVGAKLRATFAAKTVGNQTDAAKSCGIMVLRPGCNAQNNAFDIAA